jgi:Ca2+-transporting ATPase
VQEWRAEQALAALRGMLAPRCVALRNGHEQTIDAAGLVPGDVVELTAGDRVPADLRLLRTRELEVDEAALTGESLPVRKDPAPVDAAAALSARSNMAWMGTHVAAGRARGVVTATGMATEFGTVAALTQEVEQEATPLQQALGRLGRRLGIAAVVLSAGVAVLGAVLGKPVGEMLLTGISLAVAVVPEGLPAVVTLTLALGVRALLRRHALLRRLPAAESLGAARVICTDKTGTLTQGTMTVRHIWLPAGAVEVTGVGHDPAGHFEAGGERCDYRARGDLLALLEVGLRCSHARLRREGARWIAHGTPTETALLVAAYKAWLEPDDAAVVETELPFDSTRKRMTIVARTAEGGRVALVKGAPEGLLERATHWRRGDTVEALGERERAEVRAAVEQLAAAGLRTLALARRELPGDSALTASDVERGLTLLGVVGICPEVPAAVAEARAAGIQVVMVTGDAPATARAVSEQIGLPVSRSITGPELDDLDDAALAEALQTEVCFARTTPAQKLRIVESAQALGQVVGMTGDGVNDAPALKRADIGIAMGIRGTDVARQASDLVLTDDNFATIVAAVAEGRRQFANIRKFVRYLLSSNVGEIVAIACNIALGGPLILLPVQILWMNLVTDGLTAVARGAERAEVDAMQCPPRGRDEPVMGRGGSWHVLAMGGWIGIATLWCFQHYLSDPAAAARAQTLAFTGIILFEKANVLNFRALRSPLHAIGWLSNPWLLLAIAATMGIQAAAVYWPPLQSLLHTVPLTAGDWVLLVAVAAPIFVVPELVKLVRRPAS